MLRDLSLKGVYKSDEDHILEDFYLPTLSVACKYDRAVGFFSSSSISLAAQALSVFVRNEGRVRLILGAFADIEDIEAVKEGHRRKEKFSDKLGKDILEAILSVRDDLFQNRFEALSWLVAHGRLEIKIAIRRHGMYHDKLGIITDDSNDKLVFTGSANESTYALLPTHNYESITVFRAWESSHAEFYEPHIASFNRLWKGEHDSTAVLDIPKALKEELIKIGYGLDYIPDPENEVAILNFFNKGNSGKVCKEGPTPRLPDLINGHPFKVRKYQKDALNAWKSKGDYLGILELATGTGKTFIAAYAIVKFSEKISNGFVCIVAVPYQNLADQWVDVLSLFNIHATKCYGSKKQWESKLESKVHDLAMGTIDFVPIVVVNRTLKSTKFQRLLSKINGNQMLWIGDECHHHNSESFVQKLPEQAKYRIGLSATPTDYLDEEKNSRLKSFYGKIEYSYSLEDAIKNKFLTPYQYFPHIVEFTENEANEFVDLSDKIGKAMLYLKNKESQSNTLPQNLKHLLMQRSRLMGSATNKLQQLELILNKASPTRHTLFYCGDGSVDINELDEGAREDIEHPIRQVEAVSALLHRMEWKASQFTSRETRNERERILEDFRLGNIEALVAIRCLDEGIDIPACSTAYILASFRNPRQFAQRRGRILRLAPGKKSACIHDFIVVLPDEFDTEFQHAKKLIQSELERVAKFSSLSQNRADTYRRLRPILRSYDLEYAV